MHEKNIELLQEEAIRLITVESNFLNELSQTNGLITAANNANNAEKQTFDQDSVRARIEVLSGERIKLEKQELVLAVVGTMKAGKSTTINAIVGTEILPNRNRPMTALPTLIRHKAGQKEPLLYLQNKAPLTNFIADLNKVLESQHIDEKLVGAENCQDMLELASKLKQPDVLQEQYTGSDNIYQFLKMLNDLVRFSVITKTEFPFASYRNVDNLPVIEVEFAHLSDYSNQIGGLTLLDTPGPNEAGQEHLKPMLRDQLKKASAVLTVLDYTQLKSEADGVVRQELQQIVAECGDRLFVLVNKFDQRDRNADSAETLTKYVAENLMAGAVKACNVYPVSANRAFLACKALSELHKSESLDVKQAWVEDFAKAAFGEDWHDDIDDHERVIKKANSVWEKAGFTAPLQDVVKSSHENAGILSLEAAVTKINHTAQDVENFLEVRHTGLKTSVEDLQKQISYLKKDIADLTTLGDEANNKLKISASNLGHSCTGVFTDIKNKVMSDIEYYFNEGKQKEKAQREALPASKSQKPGGFFSGIWGAGRQGSTDFDATNPVIRFESKSDADELQGKIKQRVDSIIKDSVSGLNYELTGHIGQFNDYLNSDLKHRCERLLAGVQTKLEKGNFKIHIRVPEFDFLNGIDLLADVELNETKEHTKTKRGQRRKDSLWGTVCGWFNTDDWGWESYEYEQTYYDVDINAIKQKISKKLDAELRRTSEDVKHRIVSPLKDEVDKLFAELCDIIEKIRADLLQSVRDHQNEKSVQDELLNYLNKYAKHAHEIKLDSIGLDEELKTLKQKDELNKQGGNYVR
ncbi:dynamin family protein [Vibrio cholerae]|nr:dynamin family protein [Vibrio cholerae]